MRRGSACMSLSLQLLVRARERILLEREDGSVNGSREEEPGIRWRGEPSAELP